MITSEKAEYITQNLLKTADMLNAQMSMLDSMAKEGWQAIKDEVEASEYRRFYGIPSVLRYETIILSSEDVLHGLKTIAMRLDRAALIKFMD